MSIKKGNHCAYDTHYHIVFPVKYRKALLYPYVETTLKTLLPELEMRYDISFEKIGCDGNHIHILCSFHPKLSGGDIVRVFKSISAKLLFTKHPELRKELWGGELWSDGYYLATVSERGNWTVVEQYVANQGKVKKESIPTKLTLWD